MDKWLTEADDYTVELAKECASAKIRLSVEDIETLLGIIDKLESGLDKAVAMLRQVNRMDSFYVWDDYLETIKLSMKEENGTD